MILRAYKYLYYRIYSWNLRAWGESDMPQYNSLFGVSFLAFLNILSVPTALDLVIGGNVINNSGVGKLLIFGLLFVVLVISYFLLVVNSRYKKIAQDFSSETTHQKRTRLIAIWLYILGSFVVCMGLISIRNS
jgi:hypothetical protein